MSTEALGIAQTDILIRTAIIAAIKDIRENPFLLDYVFRSLADDTLTNDIYGEKEIAQAKKWILSTDFPVFMSTRLDEVKLPAISINLMESAEAEETHSDTHYVTHEDADADYPIILGPFSPKSYTPTTGFMVIPSNSTPSVAIEAGMSVIDSNGVGHVITDVIDDFTFTIEPNTVANFSKALIKNIDGSLTVTLESMSFRETIQVGCHVQGESFYLTYLHSLLVFILAGRYKQALLEARGFERSTISSSQFLKNDALGVENAYSRFINITGYVRQYWPKFIGTKTTKVDSSGTGISFGIAGSNGPPGINDSGNIQTDEDSWGVDVDALSILSPTR
jgi:hypothetical protein